MRKTILALAILSGISFQANAQLSGDDLMDITDILNDTPTATAKTPEKEKAKTVEIKKSEPVKADKKTSTPVNNTPPSTPVAPDKASTTGSVTVTPTPVIEKSKTTPTMVVPVSGTNFVLNVKRLKKSIITKTLSKDEIAMGLLTGVADDHKNDKEVVAFVEEANKNKIISFSNYVQEPNVYVGMKQKIKDGKETLSEQLATLEYGYGFIMQIKEYDKKNNRVSVRIDYTDKEIASYQEEDIITTEGVLTKVKVPTIKTSVTSNVFWIKLETDSKVSIKVNDTQYIDIVMGRVLPYVQPVIAVDFKKMAENEKAEKAAAIKAKEDKIKADAAAKEADKLNKMKADNLLYEDLENDLKK
jgi:hypothetical protein